MSTFLSIVSEYLKQITMIKASNLVIIHEVSSNETSNAKCWMLNMQSRKDFFALFFDLALLGVHFILYKDQILTDYSSNRGSF